MIKHNTLHYIIVMALVLTATACEKVMEIEPNNPSEAITITALASPDNDKVKAYITEATDFTRAFNILDLNYFSYFSGTERDSIDNVLKQYALIGARATLTVNDSEVYPMNLIKGCYYEADYQPKAGDLLRIDVTYHDLTPASATTRVPEAPKVELLGTEMVYSPFADEDEDIQYLMRFNETDSALRIHLRIHDEPGKNNYYRLLVRNTNDYWTQEFADPFHADYTIIDVVYTMVGDLFRSEDQMFRDDNITGRWGTWEKYFSNMFDDHTFADKTHDFVVQTQARRHVAKGTEYLPRRIGIRLQAVSPEFYHYTKSIMVYRVSDTDPYNDPIGIVTSVKDGWGCFGSVNGELISFDY